MASTLPKTPPAAWPWAPARQFAAQHGVEIEPHEPALGTWLGLLLAWNAQLDLTAAKTVDELLALMLADVIVLAAKIPRNARVADVGTGAGAPGLGVAILRPDLAMTLCEPLQKRAAFLRTVLGTLRRNDITLTAVRGEALAKGAFDVAISRATLPPPEWLALAGTLISPEAPAAAAEVQAEAWVLLASGEEPSAVGLEARERVLYKWPNGGHDRCAVRYLRVATSS